MSHQATEQMIGYIYQVRYALNLLLQNPDESAQISIEKFDDVSFHKDDAPEVLIQLKHHVKNHGNLTDSSTDLWRTLKVWIDSIIEIPDLPIKTKFLIITTAKAPSDSAAYLLKETEDRDINMAYQRLKSVSETSTNEAHKAYYRAFKSLGEEQAKVLLKSVYIIDKACNIIDVENDIKSEIKYASLPQYESLVLERLEGWWFKKSIEALCSEQPVFFSQNQIRSFIVTLAQEYAYDNLPIDDFIFDGISEDDISSEDRIFYEQLKLIGLGNNRIQICLRDYYRAFQQRANWIRNDLLYLNELDKYEERLIYEWEHAFYSVQDDLTEYGEELTENRKRAKGKELLSEIEKQDIRIRTKCSDAFVMRGSYHMLSNNLKVGWHNDFMERLKHLLEQR
ncbi:ABC-three component system protein [Clostridium frigidicarnis]|uniref:ABC-three component systems C-terminal domain-containing protein n=1 Tax=Clostridium frigidicarnis TaxID=84698 RepID=A0A1I0Y767_9CLOT|nr:ABC-three component system protein [Clostridium frigidicarnis]SFB08318.1 hypothetical protein SAMN04488528_101139 [Clostridium frigidicarnis]